MATAARRPGMTATPAVFLDRDGVLNAAVVVDGRPGPPRDIRQVRILPGVASACRRLHEAGVVLACVTNQPDIARGSTSADAVAAINDVICRHLRLDVVVVCPHDDADKCSCRKPQPGMITSTAAGLGLDLGRSVMVGDRWRDVEAGRRAGCRTVYIDHGYAERAADGYDLAVTSLPEAVPWILAVTGSQVPPQETRDA
jgi:D-glycero-D-manno-heptose 1,7-bisphosphate phosphatase